MFFEVSWFFFFLMVHYKKFLLDRKLFWISGKAQAPFTAVKSILSVEHMVFQISIAQLLALEVRFGHALLLFIPCGADMKRNKGEMFMRVNF